jgi:poly(A) polymerase
MHPALEAIRSAISSTPFQGDVFLVGGAVRDELLNLPAKNDFDLVTRQDAIHLANLLWTSKTSDIPPITYPRFGTAMVQVMGVPIELITARMESYHDESRKPDVQAATYLEDAQRRDFTINTLRRNLEDWTLDDPLGTGLADLQSRTLRTPLEPKRTFSDDPLRMLRAVRFRWQLGFNPDPAMVDAIKATNDRLAIVSFERIRDELLKILLLPDSPKALQDLVELRLTQTIAPEFDRMIGVEQGNFHHLDVWRHTLLVIENTWKLADPSLTQVLAALLHDVGKPETRTKDAQGRTRFFGHESLGEEIARKILRRWKLSEREIDPVALLVKNHMRLGSSPTFTKPAARRLIRDLGDHLDELLVLVEADAASLKPGVKELDLEPIRAQLEAVQFETPREVLISPLSGEEIMRELGIDPGPEVGRWKTFLTDKVLDGDLAPGDQVRARQYLRDGP